ncbi:MAG: hypothetical protein HC794_00590 [Nitrospiraceae bacterium]|nr:hypothetical protein [Nitrospiraceae bacterium]
MAKRGPLKVAFCLILALLQPTAAQDNQGLATLNTVGGAKISPEALSRLIEELPEESNLSDLNLVVIPKEYDTAILEGSAKRCGNSVEFSTFFARHHFEQRTLAKEEVVLLTSCIKSVFRHLDQSLDFQGDGYFLRLDTEYVHHLAIEAYKCGYRSQETVSLFSVAVWLLGYREVTEDERYRCIGDLDSFGTYSLESLQFGVEAISSEALFLRSALKSWSDVRKYLALKQLILRNRHIEACRSILEDHNGQPSVFVDFFLEADCKLEEIK